MPTCCAVGCRNRPEKGVRTFTIPQGKYDQERRKVWLDNINRTDAHVKSKYAILCEEHFAPDQFEPKIPGKLKVNAIPTIFPGKRPRKKRKPPKSPESADTSIFSTNLVSSVANNQNDHDYANSPEEQNSENEDTQSLLPGELISPQIFTVIRPLQKDCSNTVENFDPKIVSVIGSADEIEDSWDENGSAEMPQNPSDDISNQDYAAILEYKTQKWKNNYERITRRLSEAHKQIHNLTENLKSIFNEDQLTFLKRSSGGNALIWSDATIEKALRLRSACGKNGYEALLSEGLPFPSYRTLQRRLRSNRENRINQKRNADVIEKAIDSVEKSLENDAQNDEVQPQPTSDEEQPAAKKKKDDVRKEVEEPNAEVEPLCPDNDIVKNMAEKAFRLIRECPS